MGNNQARKDTLQ